MFDLRKTDLALKSSNFPHKAGCATVSRCAGEAQPNKGGITPGLDEECHCQRQGRRGPYCINMAEEQRAKGAEKRTKVFV